MAKTYRRSRGTRLVNSVFQALRGSVWEPRTGTSSRCPDAKLAGLTRPRSTSSTWTTGAGSSPVRTVQLGPQRPRRERGRTLLVRIIAALHWEGHFPFDGKKAAASQVMTTLPRARPRSDTRRGLVSPGHRFHRELRAFHSGLARLGRSDAVWPHHLVVFVLDDVAVPHELARTGEMRLEPCDLPWVGDDRVLEAGFPWLRRGDLAVEPDRLVDLTLVVQHEALAVHDLEGDLVDVHRMGVGGGVVDLPDLGCTDGGVLGYRVHPLALRPHPGSDRAEERLDRALDLLSLLVGTLARFLDQRQLPRDRRRRQRCDRRQPEERRRRRGRARPGTGGSGRSYRGRRPRSHRRGHHRRTARPGRRWRARSSRPERW